MAKSKQADSGGNSNPTTLFEATQVWAEAHYPAKRGQAMHPSGARIFYFVLQVFQRQYPQAQIGPDTPLSHPLAQPFLDMVPEVARHLAADFKRALRLQDQEDDQQAEAEMERFLRNHRFIAPPRLNWAAEHIIGIYDRLSQVLHNLWGKRWREAEQEQKARLWPLVLNLLLVTPVARPSANAKEARALLLQQLAADKVNGVPAAAHCYGEALDEWVLRPLLSAQWFFHLCQTLADLAQEVPALIHQRALEVGTKSASAQEDADVPKPEAQRVPPMPQGTATAEAIFAYAVLAWRLSAGAAGADPILLDAQRTFSVAEFQALIALALKATELLLWDETLPLYPLSPQSPEQRRRLRQALLPPRLRKLYEDLLQRTQRHERPPAAPLPRWEEWETALEIALDLAEQGLASSVRPAFITNANLNDLLRQPQAALIGQYLYQASLSEWLRELLSDCPLDSAALLAYCQRLAEALGGWPPSTPGAPASAEQAGRAIFWYTKRFLEAKIETPLLAPPPTSPQPEALPQRQDGGLVIWLGSGPLPPEALELAAVARLIAHVLHESSWEAARQGKPLLAAALKEGEAESMARLLKHLERRAQAQELPNPFEAAQEAWEKLLPILYHFVPPAEISEAHLKGDKDILAPLDIYEKVWYIPSTNDYEFTGDILKFANSFVRYSTNKELTGEVIPENMPDQPTQLSAISLDPQEEDRAALEVLALILEAAQTAQPSRASEDQTRSDTWLLIQDIFTHNTGRQLVDRWVKQGEPIAQAIFALWKQQLASAQEGTSIIHLYKQSDSMDQTAALARLLRSPVVQQSPERRRAVSDLFERPMHPDDIAQSGRMSLGMVERQATWALHPHWRTETLRVVGALDDLAPRQRQLLGAHLLAQEPTALTLKLLEHSGWPRPVWLSIPGPGADSSEEDDSRQLFMVARRNWMKQLSGSASTYRTRALAAEWLGYQFWDRPWRDRVHEQPYEPFYRTLLAALPPRLRPVLQAALVVASQQKLAPPSELLGVTGCLPPQLPAQIDHRFFFEAMLHRLETRKDRQPSPTDRSAPGAAMPAELRHLRRALRTIRWRTFAWFQALGGLADDSQQRIVLAAMSACAGKADQLDQWIQGQMAAPDQALVAEETRRWHHQSSIREQNVPTLMQTAAAEVKPIWLQLRRPPHF